MIGGAEGTASPTANLMLGRLARLKPIAAKARSRTEPLRSRPPHDPGPARATHPPGASSAPRGHGLKGWLRQKIVSLTVNSLERFGDVRVVRGADYRSLLRDKEELDSYRRMLGAEEVQHGAVRPEHSKLSERLDLQSQRVVDFAQFARQTSRLVADHLMTFLFAEKADEDTVGRVQAMLASRTSLEEIARDLARRNPHLQRCPAFVAARPFLTESQAFPLKTAIAEQVAAFRIVDVGAEVMSHEKHVYEPLVRSWPSVTLGFDPFNVRREALGSDGLAVAGRHKVTTVPKFIGSGRKATFHINSERATSSLYEANLDFARRFYIDQALECVETREVDTETLDSPLADLEDFRDGIDLLKIDVQGGSLEVLKGATDSLPRTLVCHLEAEFSELYKGEALFAEIDTFMRGNGFALLDLFPFGRSRYRAIAPSPARHLAAGRLLAADCVYVRQLDTLESLAPAELLKLSVIAHEIYRKYDVAAEALSAYDNATGESTSESYARAIT